jgi:Lon protease-like protein
MEIPLFPLPNLVLFPQVAVPLHIFEERYKLMVNRCIDQADIFGLVLLSEGAEIENEESILRVGVTARVVQVDRLEDGRLNILCAGEERFRIIQFTGSAPYWTADVEFFEDDPETEEGLDEAYEKVSKLYRKATELTSQLKEMEIPHLDLPDSPLGLSYMVSYVLDLSAMRKQELLESTSTVFRLRSLVDDLEDAISQLQGQVARKGVAHKAIRNGDLGKPGSRES